MMELVQNHNILIIQFIIIMLEISFISLASFEVVLILGIQYFFITNSFTMVHANFLELKFEKTLII